MLGLRFRNEVWGRVPVPGTDFCLGEWTVRPKRCSIERRDELVHIKPKSMAVLECLAGAAGEVVSRNDLFEKVWPGAIVTDDVLTHCVVELRKAFGDSARDAQVIETIPKNGFRLIPEVKPAGSKGGRDAVSSESSGSTTGKKLYFTIATVLVLALVYFVFDKFMLDPKRDVAEITTAVQVARESPINRLSIAVLPFENRSNNEEDQFFTDGIHDELLATIAKIGSLKVISRTSVMGYRDTVKKIPLIAQELGVANILEGGIQRSGNQVRINVQLIDAVTDEHLWSEIYDRELTAENLFAVQSEITKAIAESLQATLSPREVQRIDTMATENLQALEAYLRGRQLLATRDHEKIEQAVDAFNKAVELDPEFALAWVGVADSNGLLAFFLGHILSLEESFPIRENAISRALAIDENLGEAYASLGLLYRLQNLPEKAEEAFRKAILLSPNYSTAWQWYSHLLGRNPLRIDESMELLKRAAELDPHSSIILLNLANSYAFRGQYLLAERQFLKLIELDPEFELGYQYLSILYKKHLSRYDEALNYAFKRGTLKPESMGPLYALSDIYLNLGDLTAAGNTLKQMKDLDASHLLVGIVDVLINLKKSNPAGTREAFNRLLPTIMAERQSIEFAGVLALIMGDENRAKELYLSADPGWLDPDHWPELISSTTRASERDSCVFAWILINTGDEELGRQLLQQSTLNHDETISALTEHPDVLKPEICYLIAGDTEKALQSIETQLDHNHLHDWNLIHQLPMYDLIRHEPRYQAALAERERRIAIQREAIAKSGAEQGQELVEN